MASVDEKVVQLTLDNKQFNKASDETINSLEKLKKTLEFEGAIDAFDDIEDGIKKVDFAPMTDGVQKVSNQFNLLNTIADTVFRNITNKIVDTGEQMIKSLTTDQITTGWDKYAEQTGAVQTIMAATASQFEDTSEQMEAVNKQLDRLTWFTDETSHKFNDMVSGIGKFTANNIDLETSANAMQGIATWASLSGANANEASRAIYNLAQAVSVGSVKLIDWRSIENANMGTTEFKNTVIETAEEIGTLIKVADGLWSTLDGKEVSISNFSENLSSGWFNSDVLLKSLDAYGGFATELNKFVDETGVLTATALEYVDDYIDGTLDMADAMKKTGLEAEPLTEWLDKLSGEEYELGRRAFKAAQETKTFQEAIDYVKEAVSSGWSKSFKYIFGDYLDAKAWWSEIAEVMYDAFVVGGELRNEVLEMWANDGGRNDFLDGIRQGIESVMRILDIFREAWREVWYGDGTEGEQIRNQADGLLNLTKGFKELMEILMPTEETFNNLKDILKVVFTVMKSVVNVAKALGRGLSPVLSLLNTVGGSILQIFGDLARTITSGINSFLTDERLEKISYWIQIISTLVSTILQVALVAIFDIIGKIGSAISSIYERFKQTQGGIQGVIQTLLSVFNDFWQSFITGESLVSKVVKGIIFVFEGLVAAIAGVIKTVIGLISGELTFDDILFGGPLKEVVKLFGDTLDNLNLQDKFEKIVTWVKNFCSELAAADGIIYTFVHNIVDSIAYLWDKLKGLLDMLTVDDIKDFMVIAILWQFTTGLNKLNLSLKGAVDGIVGPFKTFNTFLKELTGESQIVDKLNTMFNKSQFLQIGIAVTLLVAALGKLNSLDWEQTQKSVAYLGVTLAILLAAFKTFAKILNTLPKSESVVKKDGQLTKVADSLSKDVMYISAALLMVAQSFKTMNEVLFSDGMTPEKIIAMVGSSVAIIGALVLAGNAMEGIKNKRAIGSFVGVIALAAGLRLVVNSVAVLAKMYDSENPEKLIIAAGGAAAILLALGKSVEYMSKIDWKSALAIVPMMLAFSTAMVEMTVAIGVLAAIAGANKLAGAIGMFVTEVIGITASLVILGQALKKVPASTINSISASMLAFGLAFIELSAAMKIVSTIKWDESKGAVGALAGLFAELAVSLGLLAIVFSKADLKPDRITAIGNSMLQFGLAMDAIAVSLRILNGIRWDDIKEGVAVLGGAIAIFTALASALIAVGTILSGGSLLSPVVVEGFAKAIDTLGAAFMKFGAGVMFMATAVMMLNAATTTLALFVAGLQALADKFGIDLPMVISNAFDGVELIIREFLEMLRNLAPDIFITLVSLAGLVALAIETVKHPTGVAIAGVIMEILNVIENHGEDILHTITNVINMIAGAQELVDSLIYLAGTIGELLGGAVLVAICGALGGIVGNLSNCATRWIGGGFEDAFSRQDSDSIQAKIQDGVDRSNKILEDRLAVIDNDKVAERGREAAYNSMRAMVEEYDKTGHNGLDDALVETAREAMAKYEEEVGTGAYDSAYKMEEQFVKGLDDLSERFKEDGKRPMLNVKEGVEEEMDPDEPFDWWRWIVGKMEEQFGFGIIDNADAFSEDGSAIGTLIKNSCERVLSQIELPNLFSGAPKSQEPDDGVADWDEYYRNKGKGADTAFKEFEESISDSGYETGADWVSNLGSGISSGSAGAAKEAKTAAQTIAESFADELDKISRDTQISDKLYQLWKAQNPNATDVELSAKEIEYQSEKVALATQKALVSQQIYQQTLEAMGADAKETHEAYMTMLDDQIALIEGQNKLNELQKGNMADQKEAWQRYTDLIYQKDADGKFITDWLMDQGFTAEEIQKAYASQAGYILPTLAEDTANAMMGTATETSNAAVTTMANSIVESANAAAPALTEAGKSMMDAVGQGSINNSEAVISSINQTINTSVEAAKPTADSGGNALGATLDTGTGTGIDENTNVPVTATEEMCKNVYDAACRYLRINGKVSELFKDVGGYIAQGIAVGITEHESDITDAAVAAAKAAYAAAMHALNAHSPSRLMAEVGMYYDQGFAMGITDYSSVVEDSATKMIGSLTNTTENSLERSQDSVNRYLQKMFNLDESMAHITVVVDADTTKAQESMSELERAYSIAGGNAKANVSPSINNSMINYDDKTYTAVHALIEAEAYRALQVQHMYDMVDGYFTASKETTPTSKEEESVTNPTFIQNNYSPKSISQVEVYRNTQRQLDAFSRKFNKFSK